MALWPGGEVDSLRPWMERDEATLAGRTGFVKMAIRAWVLGQGGVMDGSVADDEEELP